MIWPIQAACAFALSIDVDGDLPLLADGPANAGRIKSRSAGNYGPEHGARRLASVLADLGVLAHWFVPGEMADRYPDLVRALHAAGHGIGVHGHRHLDFDGLTLAEQVAEMRSGRAAIERIIGETPAGFRTPAGEWASGFPAAMRREGFAWSSSLPSDELPFHLSGTGLVEIPFRHELEDLQYLGYNLDPPFPPGQSRITPLEHVEANWWCEVRGAQRYGTLVHLRLHAEVMGTPGRARMLRRFLAALQREGNVWFATFAQLRDLAVAEGEDPSHPYRLFCALTAEQP